MGNRANSENNDTRHLSGLVNIVYTATSLNKLFAKFLGGGGSTGNGVVKHLLMKRLAVKQWGTMKFKVRFPDPIDTMIV